MKEKSLLFLCLFFIGSFAYGQFSQIINLSTGVANSPNGNPNNLISPNTNDDTWQVSYGGNGFIPVKCCNSSYYNGSTVIPYPCQPTMARWISPFINSNSHVIAAPILGTYEYKTTVNVGCVLDAKIHFRMVSADNNIYQIKINNTIFPISNISFVPCITNFTLNIPNASSVLNQGGSNTITIYVMNVSTYTGLLVDADLIVNSIGTTTYPFFTANTSFCINDPIVVDGSASSGPIEVHEWKFFECDQNGVLPPNGGGVGYIAPMTAGAPGLFDLKSAIGSPMACDKYYKVTLGTYNHCVGWTYTSRVIRVKCGPYMQLSGSRMICLGGTGVIFVNASTTSGYMVYIYEQPSNNLVYIGGPGVSVPVNLTVSTSYKVVLYDPISGCITTAFWNIYVSKCKPKIVVDPGTSDPHHFGISAIAEDQEADEIPGFGYNWLFEAFDASDVDLENPIYRFIDPSCWQLPLTTPNTFEGVDAVAYSYSGDITSLTCPSAEGKFPYGYTYRITRGVWNDFQEYEQHSVVVGPTFGKTGNAMAVIDDDAKAPDMRQLLKAQPPVASSATKELAIYPNPGTGMFYITTPMQGAGTIEVYDMLGNLVHTLKFTQGASEQQLDLSGFAKGVYLVHSRLGDAYYSQRILIR